MPVFPGDTAPSFHKILTHEVDGAQVIRMDLATHHGTHLDCPLHFEADGISADKADVGNFYGTAFLADCTSFKKGECIPVSHFELLDIKWEKVKWIVLQTGWYKFWGTKKYFDDFPVLSEDAAHFLVEKQIVGIGLDVISIDAIHSADYPIHKVILGNGLFIIENLTNLHSIKRDYFNLAAFPLKLINGDGSPVRAAAILD